MAEYQALERKYLENIKKLKLENVKEVTYRTDLQNFIENIKFDLLNIEIVHEGRDRELDLDGTPDFFIYKD